MTKMFTNKKILQLFIPLLIEQFLVFIVGMLDTVMVSNVSQQAVSGVSIVNDVNNLLIALLSALAGGGAVVISQFLGKADRQQTKESCGQLIFISAIFSSALTLFFFILNRPILQLLYPKVEFEVMQAASIYFLITTLSFPFLGIYNGAAAIYRCMNKTKYTMYVSMLVNLINLVGNYLCIMVLHMGVIGVALPTLISRMVGSFIMLALVFNQENPLYVTLETITVYKKTITKKILQIALPNSIENGLFQLGKVIVATFVATYGTPQITANGVTNSISTLCYTTEMAMQLAVVTIIGTTVGANDYQQTRYYIYKMLLWSYGFALFNNLLIFVLKDPILSLFKMSTDTRQIANTILTMETLAISLLHAAAFVLPSCLRAAGDAKYTMIVGVASMFLARCFGAYLLGTVFQLQVLGTRLAMYLDWIVRILFFTYRYFSKKWMNYRIV